MIEVKAPRRRGGGFLSSGLCVFGLGGSVALFFGKQGIFLGLFPGGFKFFGFGFFSGWINR